MTTVPTGPPPRPPSATSPPSDAGSASRSAASRTRSSCSAAAATSPTGSLPGMLHAAVLRSPHAARPDRPDRHRRGPGRTRRARGDHRRAKPPSSSDPMPDFGPEPGRRTPGAAWPWKRCATSARAWRWSSPTAGTSPRTRCALIDVEYEPLPPVTDPERALEEGAPLVHEALGIELRLRAHLRLRRRRARLRRGRRRRPGPAALAPFGRPAAGDRRRASPTSTRAPASSRSHTNSLSFTSYLFMVAGHAEGAGQQARHPAGARGRAASARSCSPTSRP